MKQQVLSPLHQVLIYGTVVLLQLRQFCQFWDIIRSKLANKSPYTISIKNMKMRLFKPQDNNKETKKL